MPQICCFYIHTYSTYKHIFTSIEQLWDIWLKTGLIEAGVGICSSPDSLVNWNALNYILNMCVSLAAGTGWLGFARVGACSSVPQTSLNPRKSSLTHFKWWVRSGLTCSSSNRGLACDWLSIGTCWMAEGIKRRVWSYQLSVWKAGSYFSLDLIIWKIIWWHGWTLLFLFLFSFCSSLKGRKPT